MKNYNTAVILRGKKEVQLHCKECNEVSILQVESIQDKGYIVCPSCSYSHDTSKSDLKMVDSYNGLTETKGYSIFDNGDKVKFTILRTKTSMYKGKIQSKRSKVSIIFNVETGITYLFNKENSKGKLTNISKGVQGIYNNHIYAALFDISPIALNEIHQLLTTKINEKLRINVNYDLYSELDTDYPSYSKDFINMLIALNKNPFVGPKGFHELMQYSHFNFTRAVSEKKGDLINHILGEFDLPTSKAYKKIIRSKPTSYVNYLVLKDVIKDNNNLLKLLPTSFSEDIYSTILGIKSKKDMDNVMSTINKMMVDGKSEDYLVNFSLLYMARKKDLLVDMIKATNEVIAVNKIVTANQGIVDDTARMYHNLDDKSQVEFKGTMQEIHDRMIIELNNAPLKKAENEVIEYSDLERSFEGVVGNSEFTLAEDTKSLLHLGETMNICVGSYGQSATNKRCTIVHVGTEVCIELVPVREEVTQDYHFDELFSEVAQGELKGYKIVQAKLRFNDIPQGAQRNDILNWCAENNIDTSACTDLNVSEECDALTEEDEQLLDSIGEVTISADTTDIYKELIVTIKHMLTTKLETADHQIIDHNQQHDYIEY